MLGPLVIKGVALLAFFLLIAACGPGNEGSKGAGESDTGGSNSTVTMRLISFKPEQLTIKAGTTVTWNQADPGPHTVTSGTVEQGTAGVTTKPDGRFDSGEINTGGTFEYTFDQPGTYPYFCHIHPATMQGEVIVN